MGDRRVRKMLRRMEGGQPLRIQAGTASVRKCARLAWYAEQFGYEYVDLFGTGQGGYTLLLVPAGDPRALERAWRNRARHPEAGRRGPLPPPAPEEVELLKARMLFDLTRQYGDRARVSIAVVGFTVLPWSVLLRTGPNPTAVAIVAAVWVVLMALIPVGLAYNRRSGARYAARLEAAGFTPQTDRNGRLRYVPPGGRLPGHPNPFTGGA
ncbi:hypothetical protein RKE30_37515 [Streptomyces sp. Li-HN-5-11]|uniref:hypothetical protein n=1 Tax=Streptomyces sp. Li-HN-5-11 TaxID=3075432 RepID=UPI0028B25EF7|nr:hypothetical protein [Streptomyces sp. Li-HN-5-11]WNM35655.1 hypothetical protein RKE30_37515 [Streptomyces sp. Li-HN-5-11]